MTKHTRGPWAVEPAGVDGDLDYGAPQRDGSRCLLQLHINAPKSGGGRIGRCFANCLVTTDEELHANARLIAAAPALLEALQSLIASSMGDPNKRRSNEGRWTTINARTEAVEAARAAIAKATQSP